MVDYNRKNKKRAVESIDLEYTTLAELKIEINNLIEKYGDGAKIQRVDNDYDTGYSFYVMIETPETDKEMNARIKREIDNEKLKESRDKEEYERLKKKYGS